MDKKSNRTDLLAAGRKKLQQYRQKKDNKGKDGKGKDGKPSNRSSNKADQSEHHDADANIVSAAPTIKAESSKLPQLQVESSSSLPSTVLDSATDAQNVLEISASTSSDSHNIDQFPSSASVDVGEKDVLDIHVNPPDSDTALVEVFTNPNLDPSTPTEEEGHKMDDHEVKVVVSSTSTELETVPEDALTPAPDSASQAECAAEAVDAVPLEAGGTHEGDQEAGSSVQKHYDRSVQPELGGHSNLSIPLHDGSHVTSAVSDDIAEKLISREPAQKIDVSDVAITECDEDHDRVEASVPVEATDVAAEAITGGHETLHQQGEDLTDGLSIERALHLQSMSNDKNEANQADLERIDEVCDEQSLSDGSSLIGVSSHENLTAKDNNVDSVEEQSVCPGVQGYPIHLLKLAELLKHLPESDFRYLIKSREMVNQSNILLPSNDTTDLSETFQQQLYLANISKDFFHLQLLEQHEQPADVDFQHHPVLDEVPVVIPLLSDVQERNNSLVAELSQCKVELDSAITERVELQNLYQSAKEDVVKYSAKVDELQIKLEETVGHLSCLSGELVNCKVLLEVSQVENENLLESLASATKQGNKFEEIMEQYVQENRRLSVDLADSIAQFAALQQENSNLRMVSPTLSNERKKFEEEKELLVHEKKMVSGELADCKIVMTALQQENAGLNVNLAAAMDEHNKLKEHEEFLTQEIERLSVELVFLVDKMSIDHQKHVQLQTDLKEAMTRLEQLAEENIILQTSLEIHKAKLAEVDSQQIQLSLKVGGVGTESEYHGTTSLVDRSLGISVKEAESMVSSAGPALEGNTESIVLRQLGLGLNDHDASTAVVLKGHLEEAEKMIQILEKLMDGMHSQSASLRRLAGKAAAPGVSKLIQAFESKANIDDHESEGSPSNGSLVSSDPYSSAKEQISHLRAVLKALDQNVEHVDAVIMEEKDSCKAAKFACAELEVEIEALKGFNNNLETRNIELEVLCGAMNQHAHDIEAKKSQLEDLCEALQGQEASLQSQNIELVKKLKDCHSRISQLQLQLRDIQRSSDELASAICYEVEVLQRDVRDDFYAVDRQWKSAVVELVPMLEKLDKTVGSAVSFPHYSETSKDSDVFGHVSLSLSAACEVIEQSKMKLEAAGKDHEALNYSYMEVKEKLCDLNEKHDLAIGLLQKVSTDLVNLLNVSGDHVEDIDICSRENSQQNPLDGSYYEALVEKLGSLLGGMLQLKESHVKLFTDLLNRKNEIEELNRKCLDEDALTRLILDVKEVLKLQDTGVEFSEAPASQLQSSVLLLIQKYKEAEEQASLLTNDVNSSKIEFGELQGRVEMLDSLNFQQQSEILVLRESLTQAKDANDAMQIELLEKVRELEQSEHRVASVREKLSIAVAKGKGLVVQRDSLKQSLAEMSSELEKYSQDLRVKDARLHEVEEKLVAYSEAGERMEALESELSYIRNSATALRESFLLKDSALQRIEEILEDLELPDHFHSKDILQKVDWLAKSVATNSLPPADWDQRSSVGGGSYSDAGFVVTDGGKEDVQPTSNPVDDLRRKYDELQSKFYELAEQNDMLEQSLMERNILVQRWEEILDRINTPPQIRSMEPEERIHWLGTAVSEADHHMRSLQQKVESLENYCGSLSGDLEESQRRLAEHESSLRAVLHEKESALSEGEDLLKSLQQKIDNLEADCGSLTSELEKSHRRISELELSLEGLGHDKEILSSNLATLTSDWERALDTVAQYEQEVDKLGKEVDMLHGKLVEKLGNEDHLHQIESEVRRLQHLILDVVQDSGTEDLSSDGSDIQHLERLITLLVDHNKIANAKFSGPEEAVLEHVPEQASRDMVTEMENEHVPDQLVANLDEPKSRSTFSEGQVVADLRKDLAEALDEVAYLREEKEADTQKTQALASKVESLERELKELQELLSQEEQKSASLREKLNLAVRKGKSLVQQRDSLKQNIEEMSTEIDRLKLEINIREQSLVESGQKLNDLSFQVERYKSFETENLSMKDRLVEAEQHLQQNGHTLSLLINKIAEIDTREFDVHDPLQKLDGIGKLCSDLHSAAASFEKEANKSKKAAELLLAELNEVQERNDALQEEVSRAYDELSSLSRERDLADSAKVEALSQLHKLSEERRTQLAEFEKLNCSALEVKKRFFEIASLTGDVFAKDIELLHNVSAHIESWPEHIGVDLVATKDYDDLVSVNSGFKDFLSINSLWDKMMPDRLDKNVEFDVCKVVGQHLQQLMEAIGALKERILNHSMSFNVETEQLTSVISTVLMEITSQRESLESIKSECIRLESILKEKDMEEVVMRRSISLLYDACTSSIMAIENRKAQLVGDSSDDADLRVNLPALPSADGNTSGFTISSSEDCVKILAERMLLAVQKFIDVETESVEGRSKEMRSTILNLQKELQEKDIQRERISMELVSQIKEAKATAANYSQDLQSMQNYAQELESKLEVASKEQSLLEQRVTELQQGRSSSVELGEKVQSLSGLVAAKEQEIEALMQALDEEENQMEALRRKVEVLQKEVEQKSIGLEHVEASRAKAVKKLSVTVSKFDELHQMSEGLLSEIENLQSQLQDRDAEISFLRQEVTRCTNDVLEATKMAKERSSGELLEFLTWLDTMFSQVLMRDAHGGDDNADHCREYKEHLQKDIVSLLSELEDLRVAGQRKDALLQTEKNRVEELSRRKEALERDKELHLNSLQNVGDSGLGTSEIVEVEPVLNKWTAPVTSTASQVRSLRKVNNDQVSIAIDADAGSSGRFEDDEDDKIHGFKSLTTSRFVPKFTRPVSDMIDGLWVSCDRTLMRQPAFRLGIMIYWAVLHALLASFIV